MDEEAARQYDKIDRLGRWRNENPEAFADPARHRRYVVGQWQAPDGEVFEITYDIQPILEAEQLAHDRRGELRCPRCDSPEPRLHPALQAEGEVSHICPDQFHAEPSGLHPCQFETVLFSDQQGMAGIRCNCHEGPYRTYVMGVAHQCSVTGAWSPPDAYDHLKKRARVGKIAEQLGIPVELLRLNLNHWSAGVRQSEGENMTHPAARDIDLESWLDGIGFHPANTERKQLAHEAARQLVADLGRMLHGMLPPGRDKSLVYTALEDVLMRANRAIALGGGPRHDLDDDTLRRLATHGPLEADPRVEQYKAEQRGEGVLRAAGWAPDPGQPVEDLLGSSESDSDLHPDAEGTPCGGQEVPCPPVQEAVLDVEPSTHRAEVMVRADPDVVLQISGTRLAGGGYVDIAIEVRDAATSTAARDFATYAAEQADSGRPVSIHRVLHEEADVTAAIQALIDASAHAGMRLGGLSSRS